MYVCMFVIKRMSRHTTCYSLTPDTCVKHFHIFLKPLGNIPTGTQDIKIIIITTILDLKIQRERERERERVLFYSYYGTYLLTYLLT